MLQNEALSGLVPCADKKLHKKLRAVTCPDGSVLCGMTKQYLALSDGTIVGQYDRSLSDALASGTGKNDVRVYVANTQDGGTRNFILKGRSLYSDGDYFGMVAMPAQVAPKVLMSVAAAAIAAMVGIVAFLGFAPPPEDVYPNFVISDDGNGWQTEGEINMFGEGKIAPGSQGEYNFVIANPNDVQLVYTMQLSFTYNGENRKFPIGYSLKMNNAAIGWDEVTEYGYEVSDIIFASNSTQLFALAWEWPMNGDDELDTLIGAAGGQYVLHITVSAQTV